MSSKKYSKNRKDGRPSIPEFFEGKSVFVTGGTGFLGKVLLEKLLRSCPGIDKIYILLRPKKGKSLEERMQEMLALPLFVRVKRESDNLKKLVPMKGDVIEKKLGLSEEDQKTLIDNVAVVFHVAACVRFDDPLRQAILMNTRGTYEVLELAKQMKNMESFMHISTTYCNTHKDVIEECIYPPPGDWRTLVHLAENMDKHTLEVFSQKILAGYPNTYTYTKNLAEHVVNEYRKILPIVIYRPSIVISSYLEPMPGWIDNFNGPVGLLIASGKGIIKTVYSNPKISADYVPVDITVRAMIVAAWDRATSPDRDTALRVYNGSSYGVQSITQSELVQVALHVVKDVPLNDMLWYPNGNVTICKFNFYLNLIIFQILPAIIIDTVLKLTNKKPMLLKIQRKIFVANMALVYFLTKQWSFKNEKLFEIECNMLEEDKNDFSYRIHDIDVIEYFTNSAYGARQYLLKEDNTELPEARKHKEKMYLIDKVAKVVLIILMGFLAYKFEVLPMLRGYLSLFINLLIKIFL